MLPGESMGQSSAILPYLRPPPVGRVRLRTLIVVRWIAVAGQALAILGVHHGLGYALPLAACLGAVAVSAILNAVLMLDRPRAGRLDDRAAGAVLAYVLGKTAEDATKRSAAIKADAEAVAAPALTIVPEPPKA
jgi:two-component system sensor histidine kinase RegB